ncbi:MAG: polysaccharide pyruvyl transferase family protein [Tunicatimonas sp.]
MKLCYYEDNQNFGDALNPFIFKTLLPEFFDEDKSTSFFGIGSLFGLDLMENSTAVKKIVFSTGYAKYGRRPALKSNTDVVCVRGPLTAHALGLDKSLAVADGALLLRFVELPKKNKEFNFSYMPHWESEKRFDWKTLCQECGINYISPIQDKESILSAILASEVLIAEAMHGAIVADTLRVPWIPVKSYKNISDFKWKDWAASVGCDYQPFRMMPLYSNVSAAQRAIDHKTNRLLNEKTTRVLSQGFVRFQQQVQYGSIVSRFSKLKSTKPFLSEEGVVRLLADDLRERLESVRTTYSG